MNKSYIISISQESIRLYGGRLEDNGSYTVLEVETLNTVEELFAVDELKENRTDIHLGLIFTPSFPSEDKEKTKEEIRQRGFTQLQDYSLETYICHHVKGHSYALILSADTDDLVVEYAETVHGKILASTTIVGAGKDPRIDVLSEVIWKKLVSESSYLNKEDAVEIIRDTAKRFLDSGKSELEGCITLEGERHDFFIRRKDANIDNLLDHGSNTLLSQLSLFAQQIHLDRANTIMLMTGKLVNNNYFHDILNGFTSDIKDINEEWLTTILSSVMNDLQGINFSHADSVGIDGLPLQNIKVTPRDTSIFFDITFPKGVSAIEIRRNGKLISSITDSQFRDTELAPSHNYQYSFTLVFKDENGYEQRAEESRMEIATLCKQMPVPTHLCIQETEENAIITWDNPAEGVVKIYQSNRPFPLQKNDIIQDISSLDYTLLTALDNKYQVKKDYCGERFFIPVTIVDNIGVAGEQKSILSMEAPKGIRIDSTDVNHIKVVWIWNDIHTVRIKWKVEDGNEKWKDIVNDGQEPEFEIPVPGKSRSLSACVTALYQKRDGTWVESEETQLKANLSAIKINFISAKSEARFFMHKDEYTLTLQAESEPPCDLYVLIGEGTIPLDLTNFKSHLTIHHEDLEAGAEKKFPLTYRRLQKGQPLFFRIIAADRSIPLKIVPETQKLK